ncbi:hypothetical protein [Paenibacillus zeisoli]|nr:hypothetical protein [Paenibacillus zeisoli]
MIIALTPKPTRLGAVLLKPVLIEQVRWDRFAPDNVLDHRSSCDLLRLQS